MIWPLLVGTTIFFLASPSIYASIGLISNLWFADDERGKSTAVGGLMAPLGSVIGFIVCGAVAAGLDPDNPDPAECMAKYKTMIWIQNIVYTVFCLAFILLVREKPKTPPSALSMTYEKLD